ncbi:hypothetical protein D9615_009964 [Tricholomella constricta]|uniref:Uncharacterized protein n=1 Tax=Tricholomella constricta TaxID=117010 RepID=A0A8H5GQI6_9AGAR|nr:hypothetical protein D9615_009964 [Tricholomella constricta]
MNSPPDPGSPISTDSESPPPEDILPQSSNSPQFMNIARDLTQSFMSGGGSKRRLGGSTFGGSSSNRDPKSRRRLDVGKSGGGSANPTLWEGSKESKREERDLVDHNVVDYLRKEVGDPFDDSVIQKHA